MTTTKQNWLLVGLVLIGGIALWLMYAQGKYAESEPLHQRALAIREKALGPEHPDVTTGLENYADLLRKDRPRLRGYKDGDPRQGDPRQTGIGQLDRVRMFRRCHVRNWLHPDVRWWCAECPEMANAGLKRH